MGRSKSVPIQHIPPDQNGTTVIDTDDVNHAQILGRRIFMETAAVEEREVREDDKILEDGSSSTSQIDSSRMYRNSMATLTTSLPERPSTGSKRQRRLQSGERQQPLPASSYPSSLTSLVQRIEHEENEKKLKRKSMKQQRQEKTTKSSRNKFVQFDNDTIIIPPLEVRIIAASTPDVTASATKPNEKPPAKSVIQYFMKQNEKEVNETTSVHISNQCDCNEDTYWMLSEITLPNTLLRIQEIPDVVADTASSTPRAITSTPRILPIVSRQGAIDIWSYLHPDAQVRNQRQLGALGRSVKAGTMRFALIRDNEAETKPCVTTTQQVCLQIALSQTAINNLCHKDQMASSLFDKICRLTNVAVGKSSILKSRRRKSHRPFSKLSTIKQHQIQDLFLVLTLLFPHSEFSDMLLTVGNQTKNNNNESKMIVTAQQVYALTDNVQLNQANQLHGRGDNEESHLSIPGLLPTLRPYQSKAVQWMLQRERPLFENDGNSNDEWELAWIVLSSEIMSNDKLPLSSTNDNHICRTPEFLPSWKQKRLINKDHDIEKILLFCPFTGWMTSSILLAKEWTIGPSSDTASVSGGILAESMGLGKTVEVLACILANPRNKVAMSNEIAVSSVPNENLGAKRQLKFNDDAISLVSDSISEKLKDRTSTVDDLKDFCDAEIDSDIDYDNGSQFSMRPVVNPNVTIAKVPLDTVALESTASLVTPTKVSNDNFVEERWTESDILGACICGNLIGFDTRNGIEAIVICQSCDQPMHMHCAALDLDAGMKANTRPLRYWHTPTNSSLDCRICDGEQCACCATNVVSGATLIVTPPAILHQWEREILRHTRSAESNSPLRVVIYEGVKRLTQSHSERKVSQTIKHMHPRHLASADIVLITFNALMDDLGHTDDNQFVSRGLEYELSGTLRKRKRYRVVPSPLLSIKWWRVCLDEAQRVDTPTAGSAKMALKLDSVHRWCVSGTPIHRGNLNDLYGLLLFLRLEPFWDKGWFQKCFNPAIRNTHERIKCLLHNVFWRSTKSSELVRKQMGIPEQIEKKIILNFSSIEKHFYNRQLEQTILAANDVNNVQGQLNKKSSSRLLLLTDQLHKLRAACCHPQVGSSGVTSVKRHRNKNGDNSVSSRVMTMNQILDKFIEDAKIQCEESQRLAVLHTNGMAAVSRLKIEAKCRGVSISESDSNLLEKCCQLYEQSLQLADENGTPTLVWGEVVLTGSSGFRTPGKIMNNYSFLLEWQKFQVENSHNSVWSKFEVPFGSSRKLTQVRARACTTIPVSLIDDSSADFKWNLLFPKDCSFQCMESSGEFVSVYTFSMPHPKSNNEWIVANGFRTNKSKAWRLVIESYYPSHVTKEHASNSVGTYIGIELDCYEATIANDPLQRLHCLHNASHAYTDLLQLKKGLSSADNDSMNDLINKMMAEASKIESLYLNGVRAFHMECQRRLAESAAVRFELEKELFVLNQNANSRTSMMDCWDDFWWDDFLVLCHLQGSEAQQTAVCDKVRQDLDGMIQDRMGTVYQNEIVAFPMFGDVAGLRVAIQLRVRDIRTGLGSKPTRRNHQPLHLGLSDDTTHVTRRFRCSEGGHSSCIQSILDLTEKPSEEEIHENSRCHVCKADWLQSGPKCRHCKVGDTLEELTPDKVTNQLLNSLYSLIKGSIGSALLDRLGDATLIADRAKKFFEILDSSKKERSVAYRLWRTHLNLLNDIDELNQCKSAMRLRNENEDVTELSKEQLNTIIEPIDVNATFHQYAAKQAMALGALSRAKGTLQYLKNLSLRERQASSPDLSKDDDDDDGQTCLICLSKFDTDRAVLCCGHAFHLVPCLEKLRARSGGSVIHCPLRCTTRTMIDAVMIAAVDGKRHDDGSHSRRCIKGSYGTKVTRLVNDVLDICDLGEKGIVFSQWEDMLDICEHALVENGVQLVRANSLRQIGTCTRRFREPDCCIMLLNVKNGAEGLTLVEATHVFMIEPLLNCGLDIQGARMIRSGLVSKHV